ncbi:SIS domain-containing protein [Gordonia sp. TBRC 11910]|uniref:Glutamine--fructose-6-phosphate aminotransferase [isomerizing] n=1 Tax=Gordonia asplenii TaxID=2725283 RepID=A0A848L7D0_9ACTN|nr:SIS domain-containing protein [Gordonia asplenii]NMO04411.1 SIS domain-containing protein [Gordonia asplenii]
MTTPFELDIAAQPEALATFVATPIPEGLGSVLTGQYDRIVLTGMGSSHFAAIGTWRRIVATGRPAWWIDSGQLLDAPELVTPGTLLIATSQSGASGEVVALLADCSPAAIVGVTNGADSPLGRRSDVVIDLCSGPEATVSTKSYLNTLAAQQVIADMITNSSATDPTAALAAVADFTVPDFLGAVAADIAVPGARLAYIGFGDHAATSLYSGLITKEGAKIPSDGYAGGQFRHGPLELAGPGLTAVLFDGASVTPSARQLAEDLLATGSTVVSVGAGESATHRISGPSTPLAQLVHGALVAQHLTVAVARGRGITPGAFAYGSKVTSSL